MRNGKRRVLGSLLALTMVMVAGHGVSANGRDDDPGPSGNLRVVGLTGDGRLVSFRARAPSDTGQNLAHNVNAGGVTAANGVLTYTVPPAAPVPAAGVSAVAYTNNDLNQPATATTLFDLDTMQNQVVIQSPPGAGILVATGMLNVDAGADAGFDIYSRLSGGITVANTAFAALTTNGRSGLYFVNLTTGYATPLGTFDESVVDIAIPLKQ